MSQRVAISDLGPREIRSPLRLDALGPVETTFILDEMHYRNLVRASICSSIPARPKRYEIGSNFKKLRVFRAFVVNKSWH